MWLFWRETYRRFMVITGLNLTRSCCQMLSFFVIDLRLRSLLSFFLKKLMDFEKDLVEKGFLRRKKMNKMQELYLFIGFPLVQQI